MYTDLLQALYLISCLDTKPNPPKSQFCQERFGNTPKPSYSASNFGISRCSEIWNMDGDFYWQTFRL